MIEIKEIEKLAELSRIRLTDAEKVQMQKEIGSILGYIDQIKQVSADASDATARGAQMKQKVRNILRDDTGAHESGVHTEAVLSDAPSREGDYLKVKSIL